MPRYQKKVLIGAFIISLGFVSGLIEAVFYGGRLDENNIVQESIFLPLSYLFVAVGSLMVFIGLIFKIIEKKKP